MGWDKDSLTEQHTKQTVTTILVSTRQYTEQLSNCLMPSVLPNSNYHPPGQLPHSEPSIMAEGIEHPVFFGHIGSATPSVSPPVFL